MSGITVEINGLSLDKFYFESDTVESTGNKIEWKRCNERDDKDWVGMSLCDIHKHKYSYKDGLDALREIEGDFQLGGSSNKYKYDENDGDSMNMERYYEGLPAMQMRQRTKGMGNGKFVTIHVGITENSFVGPKEFLMKAYTAIRLVDMIESLGYRTAVNVYDDTYRLGTFKYEEVNHLHLEVNIKTFNDPLNKQLLLTCLSPWMFRYHMFKFEAAKFKPHSGYGQARSPGYTTTKEDIYIDNGECLNNNSAEEKIKQILKLFSDEESK